MASTETLRISADSELSLILRHALKSGKPVIVDTGETVYRLGIESTEPEMAPARRPSPEEVERSRAGIREAAGSWRDIDAEGASP